MASEKLCWCVIYFACSTIVDLYIQVLGVYCVRQLKQLIKKSASGEFGNGKPILNYLKVN